jgi:hypothetical protein
MIKHVFSNIKKFNLRGFFLNGAYEYMYLNKQRLCRWFQLEIQIN